MGLGAYVEFSGIGFFSNRLHQLQPLRRVPDTRGQDVLLNGGREEARLIAKPLAPSHVRQDPGNTQNHWS